ncbi:MAG: HemK2/MTQ2 family protein methyltransferase [Thermoplasmata archaeon]|nr:HemK2/MTQ2 family protein methyltransferase [Thermoplasmata archaeon]
MTRTPVADDGQHLAPPSSVYPEREDTFLLLPFARGLGRGTLLDIGTGNGRLALEAARSGARTVATDLNPDALRYARSRARAEHLEIAFVRTDLARGLARFDRILANPPYLATPPAARETDRWQNLALDGGPDGCRVTARIIESLPEHLAQRGHAFLLVSSVQRSGSLEQVRADWVDRGGSVDIVAERPLEGERLFVWDLALGGTRPDR